MSFFFFFSQSLFNFGRFHHKNNNFSSVDAHINTTEPPALLPLYHHHGNTTNPPGTGGSMTSSWRLCREVYTPPPASASDPSLHISGGPSQLAKRRDGGKRNKTTTTAKTVKQTRGPAHGCAGVIGLRCGQQQLKSVTPLGPHPSGFQHRPWPLAHARLQPRTGNTQLGNASMSGTHTATL